MRIAIISDIHSNLQALQRTFQAIEEESVDRIYCLGDIVGYGANPNECIDLIRRRAAVAVRGNHDHAVIDRTIAEGFSRAGKAASEWTHQVLSDENRKYLESLPLMAGTESCTLVHSAPSDPEAWIYVLSLDVAEVQFSAFTTRLCFIGHTHVPVVCGEDLKTFEFADRQRFLINVGSVGQPRDGNPDASFGVLDTERWTYENKRIAYDVAAAAEAIEQAGLPEVLSLRLLRGI